MTTKHCVKFCFQCSDIKSWLQAMPINLHVLYGCFCITKLRFVIHKLSISQLTEQRCRKPSDLTMPHRRQTQVNSWKLFLFFMLSPLFKDHYSIHSTLILLHPFHLQGLYSLQKVLSVNGQKKWPRSTQCCGIQPYPSPLTPFLLSQILL